MASLSYFWGGSSVYCLPASRSPGPTSSPRNVCRFSKRSEKHPWDKNIDLVTPYVGTVATDSWREPRLLIGAAATTAESQGSSSTSSDGHKQMEKQKKNEKRRTVSRGKNFHTVECCLGSRLHFRFRMPRRSTSFLFGTTGAVLLDPSSCNITLLLPIAANL